MWNAAFIASSEIKSVCLGQTTTHFWTVKSDERLRTVLQLSQWLPKAMSLRLEGQSVEALGFGHTGNYIGPYVLDEAEIAILHRSCA